MVTDIMTSMLKMALFVIFKKKNCEKAGKILSIISLNKPKQK